MIEGRNIKKSYDGKCLFENLNFVIEDQDFICFSGESGAGKTTLLNIIGLLEPIDSGEILFDGKKYTTRKELREYYRTTVGFLFQNFALIESKTVKENLEIVSKESRTEYTIKSALEKVGLDNKLNSKIYTLSGGEQQRVALARLFLKKCKIILADEPTGSLDKRNALIVMDILKQLNEEGKIVIFVTHDEELRKRAKRVVEL